VDSETLNLIESGRGTGPMTPRQPPRSGIGGRCQLPPGKLGQMRGAVGLAQSLPNPPGGFSSFGLPADSFRSLRLAVRSRWGHGWFHRTANSVRHRTIQIADWVRSGAPAETETERVDELRTTSEMPRMPAHV